MNGNFDGKRTRFKRLVDARGGLGGLFDHARWLGALQARIAATLPKELRMGWQLARLDAELMVVVVDSPARATRFRYAQAALLHAAQQCASTRPKSLKVRIAPQKREPAAPEPRTLSPEIGRLLTESAATVEDAKLRRALLKLARHARKE